MRILKIFTLCLFTITFTSCNFTEEITINENGSGEFVMNYDMSSLMESLKEMGMDESTEEKDDVKVIDSVMYMKDLLVLKADSIAQLPEDEQKQLKSLETVLIKMRMNEKEGAFDFGFGSTFTSLKELPTVFEKIEETKKLNSKNSAQYSKMSESAIAKTSEDMLTNVDFEYDGNVFRRFMKSDLEGPSQEEMEALDKEMAEMGEMKEMFDRMSYTLLYNFPKKVKSVSNKKAEIINDGMTVRLTMNFLEMVKSPNDMNLEIIFE